jgi:hypothetical protein
MQLDEILRLNERHGGTIFHEPAFNKIASEVFHTRLSYFLAMQDGLMIGFCPCHSFKDRLLTHSFSNLSSYEIPYGGWVFDDSRASYSELLRLTPLEFTEGLHISTSIDFDPERQVFPIDNACSTLRTLVLKICDMGAESIFDQFSSKQKNKIRRAYKVGVRAENISPDNFDVFWDLSSELKRRTGLKIRDKTYYKRVFSHYHNLGMAQCIAAKHHDEFISTMILMANPNYAIAWVAGRKSDLPNNLYQNEMLFWEAIKWGISRESKYFDFCGLDEEKLPQLARIKLSFSDDVKNFYTFTKKRMGYRVLNRLHVMIP